MYLSQLKLWNFRKYRIDGDPFHDSKSSLTVRFQNGVNVLIGKNNSGKTIIIDAHLRGCEAMDDKVGTAILLKEYYADDNIDWLRKLRNSYVHHNTDRPTLGMNYHFEHQDEMEKDVTTAMKMTIKALFQNPGW